MIVGEVHEQALGKVERPYRGGKKLHCCTDGAGDGCGDEGRCGVSRWEREAVNVADSRATAFLWRRALAGGRGGRRPRRRFALPSDL